MSFDKLDSYWKKNNIGLSPRMSSINCTSPRKSWIVTVLCNSADFNRQRSLFSRSIPQHKTQNIRFNTFHNNSCSFSKFETTRCIIVVVESLNLFNTLSLHEGVSPGLLFIFLCEHVDIEVRLCCVSAWRNRQAPDVVWSLTLVDP